MGWAWLLKGVIPLIISVKVNVQTLTSRCLIFRAQSSQKPHLQTAIVSTHWRDIQSHLGLKTSSLMTATQSSLQMRLSTPCPVRICVTLYSVFYLCNWSLFAWGLVLMNVNMLQTVGDFCISTNFLIDTCHLQALTFYTVFTFISFLCIPICVCVCVCMHLDSASPSKRTSVSSSHSVVDSDSAASINLNMEQNNVNFHVKKQSKYPHVPPAAEQKGKYSLLRYDLYVRILGHSDIVCH